MRATDPTAIPYILSAWSAQRVDGEWSYWFSYDELPGCVAEGPSAIDALERLERLRERVLEGRADDAAPPPGE